MGWPVCNNTEEFEESERDQWLASPLRLLTFVPVKEIEVYYGLTFHQMGLILSAACGAIAVLVSFYLIMMHATHYLRPWEQRQ